MLSIRHFCKRYHQRAVLVIDSLDFPAGAYWIQGENGSGKSTFFKAIAGLIPFEGTIAYNGFDNRKHRIAFHQALGYAEAEPLYPDMLTAHDLISFAAGIKKVGDDDYARLMVALGIGNFQYQPVRTFSSGMVKKLSIALALLGEPQLVILDEPYITLDSETREILDKLLIKHLERGATFLFSSHQAPAINILPITACYRITAQQLVRV